jgi:hypothetical protein
MKRVGRSVASIALVSCLITVATTGLAPAVPRAKATTVSGDWTGTWKRTSSAPTTGTMTCLTTNTVHGTVNGKKVTVAVSEEAITAKYTAAVSGSKMSGGLAVTCSGVKGVGTFSLSHT